MSMDHNNFVAGFIDNPAQTEAVCLAIEAGHCGPARPAMFGAAKPALRGFFWEQVERGNYGVFLSDAQTELFDGVPVAPYWQDRGICCELGTGGACETSLHYAQQKKGYLGRKVRLFTAILYGLGRSLNPKMYAKAGNNPNNDGMHGGIAARIVGEFGFPEQGTIGQYDCSKERQDLSLAWADSHVPAEIVKAAKGHTFLTQKAEFPEELGDAIYAGYAGALCLPFICGDRDENGFSEPVKQGGHCTQTNGFCLAADDEPVAIIKQSWNGLPKGPNVLKYKGGTYTLKPGEYALRARHWTPYMKIGSGGETWVFEAVEENTYR